MFTISLTEPWNTVCIQMYELQSQTSAPVPIKIKNYALISPLRSRHCAPSHSRIPTASIHQETHSSSVTSSISSGGTVSDFQASWEIKSLQCVLRLPQNSLPVVQARNTSFRRHSGSILVRSLNHLHWLNIGSSKQPFEGNLFLSLVFVISFFLSLTRGHGVWWEWKHRLTGKSQLHF